MLNEDDCRFIVQDCVLDLNAGKNIHEVERFIPNEEIGILTETSGQQYLLLLTVAVILDAISVLRRGEIQFSEHCPKTFLVDTPFMGVLGKRPVHTGSILRNIRYLQPVWTHDASCIADILPAKKFQQGGLAAAVLPGQSNTASGFDLEADV